MIRHRDNCPGARMRRFLGHKGDPINQCLNCGAWVIDRRARVAPAVVESSRFRCREHGQPVTWKGTGCLECVQ